MADIIGIRFREVGKVYYFDPDGEQLNRGDYAIVETSRGIECGEVAMANREIADEAISHPLKKMIRKATPEDLARVRDNKEREVATELTLDLTGKHRHRVTLAAPLRMPEYAQLAVQFLTVLYGAAQVIHTHELVVLGDNLYRAVLEQDKVFNVVNKRCLVEQTPDHILRAYALAANMLAVNLVVFAFLEPFEEVIVACVERSQLGFKAVRKNAHLVQGEQVRDFFPVILKILVIGFFNLDGAVLEFDKD